MKLKLYYIPLLAASLLASCSGKSSQEGADTAQNEAADIEAAVMQGRTAARAFLDADTTDTLAIQSRLLEARAIQSRYITAGKTDYAEAFDTAFIHTLRAANPAVARAVERVTH